MKDYNKKFHQYLLKGHFKLVFNNNKDCKYLTTDMINNTTNISLSNYLRDVISNLKEKGYDFSHIVEMNIITLAHKCDMTYDLYLKHNMSAFEWKLNAMTNKDKNLINKFPKNWSHPINTKFNRYCDNNN